MSSRVRSFSVTSNIPQPGSSKSRPSRVYEENQNQNPFVKKVTLGAEQKKGSRRRTALACLGNIQKSKQNAEPKKKLNRKPERVEITLSPVKEDNTEPESENRDVDNQIGVHERTYFSDLLKTEAKYPIQAYNFSAIQRHPEFRKIIIDRLISIHTRFNLKQQTLFLGINLLDRYLQTEETVHSLRLITATAIFIATKYVEGRTLSDHKLGLLFFHSKREVVEMEFFMLKTLNFALCRPTPLDFLNYFINFSHNNITFHQQKMAEYLMELTLMEYEFSNWLPSKLATACLCASLRYSNKEEQAGDLWPHKMAQLTGYEFDVLRPLIEKLANLVLQYEGSKFQAVREKYSLYLWEKLNISPLMKQNR